MQLLQQRTLLGSIEGAEDNVDLGALLIRLKSVTPAGALRDKISAALTEYRSSILSFQHDQILPDVSGLCVFESVCNRVCRRMWCGCQWKPAGGCLTALSTRSQPAAGVWCVLAGM
jgi:hypothetical protein